MKFLFLFTLLFSAATVLRANDATLTVDPSQNTNVSVNGKNIRLDGELKEIGNKQLMAFGEKVYSLVFQHIIVPEIYDALVKTNSPISAFSYKHIYNKGEYYHLDEENANSGMLREKPCPGYYNYGQFDALVEQGDVLAMFVGHDHSNSFSVKHKGIDLVNTLSARYNWPFGSTSFGYRVITVDESDTSTYQTQSVRYDDFIDDEFASAYKGVDTFGYKLAHRLAFRAKIRKAYDDFCVKLAEFLTDRKVKF